MKFSLYIAGLAFIIVSCSTTRNFSSIMEDDIYYVPGKKALAIREVENLTGHDIGTEQPVDPTVLAGEISRSAGSSTPPATFSSSNNTKINARSGQLEQVNIQSLTREAEEKLANNEEIDMTLYENTDRRLPGAGQRFGRNTTDHQYVSRRIRQFQQWAGNSPQPFVRFGLECLYR